MKKIVIPMMMAALTVSGGGSFAAERVTVLLEDNVDQIRQSAESLAYRGDPELHDAFRTLQTRLQTMLVSSGRVDVKPKTSIGKTLTRGKVYLCSYTLVQGNVLRFRSGKTGGYIIGVNLQAWNYLTETALPELTRTVELRVPATTPETALAYVARYLAFVTLETLSPVTVLERDGNDIRVDAGDELLKKGDVLQIREGLRKKAFARVVETERKSVVAELTDGDLSLVQVGAQCRFVLPEIVEEPGMPDAGPKVPTVKIAEVRVAAMSANVSTYNVQAVKFRGRAGQMYRVVQAVQTIDLSGLPEKLSLQLRTAGPQGTGVRLLAMTPTQEQDEVVDYVLECAVSGYNESHTSGQATESGMLLFHQKAALTVHFEMKETLTGTVMVADDVKSVMQQKATGQRQAIEDALIADCAKQIAMRIQNAVAKP
jgi:hypothetical protein